MKIYEVNGFKGNLSQISEHFEIKYGTLLKKNENGNDSRGFCKSQEKKKLIWCCLI